jgi:hypothetical protein
MLGVALTSTFMLTAAMAAADHDPSPTPPAVPVPTTRAAPVSAPTGT